MTINNHSIQFPFDHGDMQTRVAYNAAGDVEYIGLARPGALTTAAEWQIKKIIYDATPQSTAVLFADGVNDYVKVWDDRDHYAYTE